MNHFISCPNKEQIKLLIDTAVEYKTNPLKDLSLGKGKRIGLIFFNPSIRTRLSTEIAAKNLGIDVVSFNINQDGWTLEFEDGALMNGHTVEHVKDAAPILGTYFDILGIRIFPSLKNKNDDYSELYIKQFITYAGIPVICLESATLHPLQSLTDLITIEENFNQKRKPKIVLTWAPHVKALPQCVANSFSQWITEWGEAEFVIAHPPKYELDSTFTRGTSITHHQEEALKNADFVYIKNWSTYTDYGKIHCHDPEWMLTLKKLTHTNQAKIMHCLPVRRNVEVSDEVLDCNASIVTQQASNRVWAAQAVLAEILKNKI